MTQQQSMGRGSDPAMAGVVPTATVTQVARPHLAEGQPITVDPKNPIFSTTLWGIVITILFGWLSKHSWWAFDQSTTTKAVEEFVSLIVGPAVALYGRWRATRPLGFTSAPRSAIVGAMLMVMMMTVSTGCGASKSYVITVQKAYPVVATRLDGYGKTAEAVTMRQAAVAPVTFPKASAAWASVRETYRQSILDDRSLSATKTSNRLETADRLDALQEQERKHSNVFLLGPVITPPPTTMPARVLTP